MRGLTTEDTESTENETRLFFLDEKAKIHFGLGYNVPLPDGWILKEDQHEFTLGVSPDGQEYYLGDLYAFPRRWNVEGYFYLDKDNGVINLRQGGGITMNRSLSDWISVDQSLPDENTDVIVACEDGYVQAGYLDGREWQWINCEKTIKIGVTHWMPFPNPPEG